MEISLKKPIIGTALFDATAILLIYLLPTISHLVNFPLYVFEPMRIMLFISLAHFRKSNAYLIALTLPLFSFLVSAHPVPPKMILITLELLLNVYLFFLFREKLKNMFAASFLSILVSKSVYYLLKYGLISFVILEGSLVSTSLYIQLIVSVLLSLYLSVFLKKGENLKKVNI